MASASGNGYPTPPPPGFADSAGQIGQVQHLSLRLSGGGGGGRSRNGGGSFDGGMYVRHVGGSTFSSAPGSYPDSGGGGSVRRGSPLMGSSSPAVMAAFLAGADSHHHQQQQQQHHHHHNAGAMHQAERSARARSYDGRSMMTAASSIHGGNGGSGGRSMNSASLSPPGGEIRAGDSVNGDVRRGMIANANVGGAGGGGFDLDTRARRSSYDERMSAHPWVQMHEAELKHSSINNGSNDDTQNQQRPANLSFLDDHFQLIRARAAASAGAGYIGGSGGTTLRSGSSSGTRDAIPTQCAEFALLTPKRALAQQISNGGGDGGGMGASQVKMWPSGSSEGSRGASTSAIGHGIRGAGQDVGVKAHSGDSGSVGSGSYTGSGLTMESQVWHQCCTVSISLWALY